MQNSKGKRGRRSIKSLVLYISFLVYNILLRGILVAALDSWRGLQYAEKW